MNAKLNQKDIIVQKKENDYFLYSPAHNCIVKGENLDTSYEKLVNLIAMVDQKRADGGFPSVPLSLQQGKKKNNLFGKESAFLMGKFLILAIVVISTLQLSLYTSTGTGIFNLEETPVPSKILLKSVALESKEENHFAYNLLDGANSADSFWEISQLYSIVLNFENVSGEQVFGYFIQTGDENSRMPSGWKFQGSVDNKIWVNLDTRTKEPAWEKGEKREYSFKNLKNIRYFRFVFMEGPPTLRIYEVGIYK